ncbi:transcriptional regulator [Bradyrhizobium sp. 83002]|uniref:ATP-binding protein n=1 Tax=Bradyrhizobium aeschynomenes TaxID=2734909 RepID=UPI0015551025|nr:winged helix-turn-helix domain-containing protein [Bradyrhizobium aeschynomenes]NPU09684.1 transcriptional regulator [Bradyrhizobium aeschynomenes]
MKATERLLLRDNEPVDIGGRALDLLIALTDRGGQVVSKQVLMDLVWPDTTVEEASLRVHIAALRKVLGDGRGKSRYIVNVAGRGYCFVEQLRSGSAADLERTGTAIDPTRLRSLPPHPHSMIGRAETVSKLSSLLVARRFVSIVGPGGIGKTTVAIAAAHLLKDDFGHDGICFVDLSSLVNPAAIGSAAAAAAGCLIPGVEPETSLLAALANMHMLLVFDNCEHVIQGVASIVERIYREAPQVHILTTSREALRAEGENVFFLSALETPVDSASSAREALAFPAVQLFMERAAASGYVHVLEDMDASIVARICRRLDGIPLAIELVSSRVGRYGIRGIADLLDSGAALFLQGLRSARIEHQTLKAMLDWSFELLSADEQSLFRDLSVLAGWFTMDAARSVAADGLSSSHVFSSALIGLVDKSLVTASSQDNEARFRLLETTRVYAATKLLEAGDADSVAGRHASYFLSVLRSGLAGEGLDQAAAGATIPHLDNIRKALAWSLSTPKGFAIGVELAAGAVPLFLQLSLYEECVQWCRQALKALKDLPDTLSIEIEIQGALAISLMSTHGNSAEVRQAIERGLSIAEALCDGPRQYRFLIGLHIFLFRLGDYRSALAVAERSEAVAQQIGSKTANVITEWALGDTHRFIGDQLAGLRHFEQGFRLASDGGLVPADMFGLNHRIRAGIGLAHCLWLRGLADRARDAAYRTISEAGGDGSPISSCHAHLYGSVVFIWTGDFDEAERILDVAKGLARKYSLGALRASCLELSGEIMVARGRVQSGVETLEEARRALRSQHYNVRAPAAACALADGLAKCGRAEEAIVIADEALALAEGAGWDFWMPDLLRVRAEVLLALTVPDFHAAEESLLRSIENAHRQAALSWELRGAIPLAKLWSERGQRGRAQEVLETLYLQFTEGFETQDLVTARRLLEDLREYGGRSSKDNEL